MSNTTAVQRAEKVTDLLFRNRGYFTLAIAAMVGVMMLAMPEMAMAQSIIDDKADAALTWIRRAVYFILVVAVLGSGVLAAFGRMSWATVGQVLIGAIVAGVATEVVSALYGDG
ncbi:TrbC/VirB2 family protein [Luteimonas soli]|uniref:TrbC/VirB2 family protein n=1 Tax=Luteimonas soli TaxID=1648966 RepID=A0ABV7XI27_9GAMM